MPLAADSPQGVVYASEFQDLPNDVDIYCPYCESHLHFRSGNVTPHFAHSKGESCRTGIEFEGGSLAGESEEHELMKFAAKERLEEQFGDTGTIELEYAIGDKRADVVAVFDSRMPPYGNGVVVEVQYRNDGKDYLGATDEFISNGFSIHWVFSSQSQTDELFNTKETLNAVFALSVYIEQTDYPRDTPDLNMSNALTPQTETYSTVSRSGTPIGTLNRWKQNNPNNANVSNIPPNLDKKVDQWLQDIMVGSSSYDVKKFKKSLMKLLPHYSPNRQYQLMRSDECFRYRDTERFSHPPHYGLLDGFREVAINGSPYLQTMYTTNVEKIVSNATQYFSQDARISTGVSVPYPSIHGDIEVEFERFHPLFGKGVIIDFRLLSPPRKHGAVNVAAYEYAYIPVFHSDSLQTVWSDFESFVRRETQEYFERIAIWDYYDLPLDKEEYDPLSKVRKSIDSTFPLRVTLPPEWIKENIDISDPSGTLYSYRETDIDPDSFHVECPHCYTTWPPNQWNYCPRCDATVAWEKATGAELREPRWLRRIPEQLHPNQLIDWIKEKQAHYLKEPRVTTLCEEIDEIPDKEIKSYLSELEFAGVITITKYGEIDIPETY